MSLICGLAGCGSVSIQCQQSGFAQGEHSHPHSSAWWNPVTVTVPRIVDNGWGMSCGHVFCGAFLSGDADEWMSIWNGGLIDGFHVRFSTFLFAHMIAAAQGCRIVSVLMCLGWVAIGVFFLLLFVVGNGVGFGYSPRHYANSGFA